MLTHSYIHFHTHMHSHTLIDSHTHTHTITRMGSECALEVESCIKELGRSCFCGAQLNPLQTQSLPGETRHWADPSGNAQIQGSPRDGNTGQGLPCPTGSRSRILGEPLGCTGQPWAGAMCLQQGVPEVRSPRVPRVHCDQWHPRGPRTKEPSCSQFICFPQDLYAPPRIPPNLHTHSRRAGDRTRPSAPGTGILHLAGCSPQLKGTPGPPSGAMSRLRLTRRSGRAPALTCLRAADGPLSACSRMISLLGRASPSAWDTPSR